MGILYFFVGLVVVDGKYVLILVDVDLSILISDIKKFLIVVKSGGVEIVDFQLVKGLNWVIKVECCKVGGCVVISGFLKDF